MFSSRRFSAVVRLALVAAFLLPLGWLQTAWAQDASPAAGQGVWVGSEPDLAAMAITPADLEAIGLPGFGRFFNGYFNNVGQYAENAAGYYGQPVEETQAAFDRMGLRRHFGLGMGLPSVPGEESPPERGAYTNLIEIENAAEGGAYFDYVTAAAAAPDSPFTVAEAPFALGDRAIVVSYSSFDPEAGETFHEYFLIFQTGNLFVDAGFFTTTAEDAATPEATPAAVDGAPMSPAATLEELEALGQRQLERVEAVLAEGSPNLPSLLLRLGDDPLEATADYTEGYRLLDGEVMPYYNGRDDDIIADPAVSAGADAAYELEENFRRGEESVPGEDYYYLARLFAFPNEDAAAGFMAGRAEALAAGGFAKVSEAAPGAGQELLPSEATDLGDESLAFSFVRAFADGNAFAGYEVYVRVGETVAAVSMEGPPDMPLALVTEIAAAQAACLEADACPEALAVPEAVLASSMATPEATPVE